MLVAPVAREGVGARSALTLLLGALLIVVWQISLAPHAAKTDAKYRVTAASGINQESRAFFFMRHLGIFPLMTRAVIREDTRAEAERQVREQSNDLLMDDGSTFRSGDRGRTYLYWVDGLWRGRALLPSLVPAHALAFSLALCALWAGFWWQRRPLLGALFVAVLGSNPWQLFATYAQENVFSWPITTFVLVLGLCLPLMDKQKPARWYPWLLAVLLGVGVATVRTIRSEPVMLLLSVSLVYAGFRHVNWRRRAAMVLLMGVLFAGTNKLYDRLFVRGVEQTNAWMRRVGGTPYNGPVRSFHEVWHALYCGLGDHDKTLGYQWNDVAAFAYAYPILRARHGDRYQWNTAINYLADTYDSAGKYPIFWAEVPGYHDVIRDKVVGDIKRNPRWFATILAKRVGTILEKTTPVSVAVGAKRYQLEGEWVGPAALLALIVFAFMRRWRWVLLIVFAAPLSSQALIVYSLHGMTYYGCFHLVAFVLIAYALARALARVVTRWSTASDAQSDAPAVERGVWWDRVKTASGAVMAMAMLVSIGRHLADRAVAVRASSIHSQPYHARNVLDSDLDSHWFLPDLQLGWLELAVPAGRVRVVRVWNVHNNAFHCTGDVSVELRQGARVVATSRANMTALCNTDTPQVFSWPAPVEADRVRINVESFSIHGAGIPQVRVE